MMQICLSTASQRCAIKLRSGDCGDHLSIVGLSQFLDSVRVLDYKKCILAVSSNRHFRESEFIIMFI